jgi:hypothetical protein
VTQKLKGKFYRTAIRLINLYGAKYWPIKRRHIQQLSVTEMRMLRWICVHTKRYRVRDDDICERLVMTPVEEKLDMVWTYTLEVFGGHLFVAG